MQALLQINMSVKYLFLTVIVCIIISTGSCLECYECMAYGEINDCMDPKAYDLELQECYADYIDPLAVQVKKFAQNFDEIIGIDSLDGKQSKYIANAVICQKIESTVNNKKLLIRGCQLKTTTDYCKVVEKVISGTLEHCSICEEDGCNAAHWLAPLSTIVLLVPALALTIPTLMFL